MSVAASTARQLAEPGDVAARNDQQVAEVRARVTFLLERWVMEGRGRGVFQEKTSGNSDVAAELAAH
jgi:hypothetical protein